MKPPASPDRNHPSQRPPASSPAHRIAPPPIVLWRLRGATDDLRGLIFETSFGFAFGLELAAELVLLHLQPSLESLVTTADRIQSALITQGWQLIPDTTTTGRSLH